LSFCGIRYGCSWLLVQTTERSPMDLELHDGITRKENDHILTTKQDRCAFKLYRVFRGAEVSANTEHCHLREDRDSDSSFRIWKTTMINNSASVTRVYSVTLAVPKLAEQWYAQHG